MAYVSAKTFNDFVCNQKELVSVLNHNMSDLSKNVGEINIGFREVLKDVKWIKKIIWWIMGIFSVLVIIGLTQS
jgi:t-SNARE complex subunit (syntaxin)